MKGLKLQTRLVVLSSMLVVASMVIGLMIQVVQARIRVGDEMQSALDLAWELIDAMLPPESATLSPQERAALLKRLKSVEAVRHLDIRLIGNDGDLVTVTPPPPPDPVPYWFSRLVQLPAIELRRSLAGSADVLLIRSNAAAEMGEVWRGTLNFLAGLLLELLGINIMLYVVIRRWLAPVDSIVVTLENAERGDFSEQKNTASLPELRTIIDKLNRLIVALRSSKAENERLAQQSLQIQEDERRTLARELHDEMGQALSAIKAIAWSLQQRGPQVDAGIGQGAERIGGIAAVMSGHVRSMLGRLRPALLDELGLVPALRQMVESWNQAHQGCRCTLQAVEEFAEVEVDQQIHIYRIVQEALTNVALHALAHNVAVVMTADSKFRLEITDDGKGFDPARRRPGRGLMGMRERCQTLGGEMSVLAAAGGGTSLVFVFPRPSQAQRGAA